MNRRQFFKLAMGAAAAVAVPQSVSAGLVDAPVIYADGIGDDTAGLNALIRGEIVQFANPEMATKIGWRGNTLHLAGTFRTEGINVPASETPIVIDGGNRTSVEGIGPTPYLLTYSDVGIAGMTTSETSPE